MSLFLIDHYLCDNVSHFDNMIMLMIVHDLTTLSVKIIIIMMKIVGYQDDFSLSLFLSQGLNANQYPRVDTEHKHLKIPNDELLLFLFFLPSSLFILIVIAI